MTKKKISRYIAFFAALIFSGLILSGSSFADKVIRDSVDYSMALNKKNISIPRNIILIGWDGAGREIIKELMKQGKLPNLQKLSQEGGFVDIDITNRTDTKAGWAEILTGYDYRITGVYDNYHFASVPDGYTILERVQKFYGASHIAVVAVIGKPFNLDADKVNDPYFHVKGDLDVWDSGKMRGNYIVRDKAMRYLSDFGDVGTFYFFHFGLADCDGHRFGSNSAEYINAVISYDDALGRIMDKLKELNIYNSTIIYVTADHGFDNEPNPFPKLGTHKNAPAVFLVANDKTLVKRTGNRLDIAPTILKRWGIDIKKIKPPLPGSPLTE